MRSASPIEAPIQPQHLHSRPWLAARGRSHAHQAQPQSPSAVDREARRAPAASLPRETAPPRSGLAGEAPSGRRAAWPADRADTSRHHVQGASVRRPGSIRFRCLAPKIPRGLTRPRHQRHVERKHALSFRVDHQRVDIDLRTAGARAAGRRSSARPSPARRCRPAAARADPRAGTLSCAISAAIASGRRSAAISRTSPSASTQMPPRPTITTGPQADRGGRPPSSRCPAPPWSRSERRPAPAWVSPPRHSV